MWEFLINLINQLAINNIKLLHVFHDVPRQSTECSGFPYRLVHISCVHTEESILKCVKSLSAETQGKGSEDTSFLPAWLEDFISLWILPSISLAFHFNSKEEAGNLGLTCLESTLKPSDVLCFHPLRFWSLKRLKSVRTKLFFSIVDDTTIFRHKLSSNEEWGSAKMSKPGSWRWLWYFC